MKLMIQKLLVDRFQLKFHTEKKELPVYAMVVAKGGPKLTVSAADPNAFPGIGFGREPGVISLVGRNTGLNGVANGLQSNILDKPVVDRTGLTGRYDFQLRFMPDANQRRYASQFSSTAAWEMSGKIAVNRLTAKSACGS